MHTDISDLLNKHLRIRLVKSSGSELKMTSFIDLRGAGLWNIESPDVKIPFLKISLTGFRIGSVHSWGVFCLAMRETR